MNQPGRTRALSLVNLRTFEAVARRLNFSQAAAELHLTQSAVSRQIQALEDELGAPLFSRGTRRVELSADGATLLRAVAPWLDRLDASVRQIRNQRGRRVVNVTTFASFASMWLIPRMEAFQREHPQMDIRVSANDAVAEPGDPDLNLALRYCGPERAPLGAERLFGETLTPVISPRLAEQARDGLAPPLSRVEDLAQHTLAEEDTHLPGIELSWREWLHGRGLTGLQPRRWLYLNFTYQQVQAALAGQAVALARLPLVAEALRRGDLIEPFGAAGRVESPYAYWLVTLDPRDTRPEVGAFAEWVRKEAARTRLDIAQATGRPA